MADRDRVWAAIADYVRSCGGVPDRGVFGAAAHNAAVLGIEEALDHAQSRLWAALDRAEADLFRARGRASDLEREIGDTLNRLQEAHAERDAAREALREACDLIEAERKARWGSYWDAPAAADERDEIAEWRQKGGIDD